MARSSGFGSYRGRSPLRTFLKAAIILLAAVLIFALLALLFFQQYVVYSADGIRLDLPFVKTSEHPATASGTPDPIVSEPLAVATPEAAVPEWLHAVQLPMEALYDGTAAQRVGEAGGNAAIFDMKSDDGSLGYVSQLPLAISAKVSSGNPAVNAAIRAINEKELYTVARVSCFKDHNLSDADRSLAITTNSGYRWTDSDKVRWVSPTNEAVREYVTGVCVELAELGFDEILLVNSGYPAEGNLNYIKKGSEYNKADFSTVIDGFYAQIADALKGYDVKLSVLTDEATVTGGGSMLSGQTVNSLISYAERIWIPCGDPAASQVLADAGILSEDIVCVSAEPTAEMSSWAILFGTPRTSK